MPKNPSRTGIKNRILSTLSRTDFALLQPHLVPVDLPVETQLETGNSRIDNVYLPDPANSAIYDEMYAEYRELHDYFGRGGNGLMRSLRQRRREATSGQVRV